MTVQKARSIDYQIFSNTLIEIIEVGVTRLHVLRIEIQGETGFGYIEVWNDGDLVWNIIHSTRFPDAFDTHDDPAFFAPFAQQLLTVALDVLDLKKLNVVWSEIEREFKEG